MMNPLEVAKAFGTSISENFDSYLETFGFKRTRTEVKKNSFSIIVPE